MVFEGMVAARRVVDIVEELAICKKQLEDVERKVERKGDWVFDKLEDVTMDLADIAHKLFTHCMNDAGVGENICKLPPSVSSTSCPPDNEDYQMEDIGIKVGENGEHTAKTARICRLGTSCGFAQRGRCAFYHPEPGKSKETVITII